MLKRGRVKCDCLTGRRERVFFGHVAMRDKPLPFSVLPAFVRFILRRFSRVYGVSGSVYAVFMLYWLSGTQGARGRCLVTWGYVERTGMFLIGACHMPHTGTLYPLLCLILVLLSVCTRTFLFQRVPMRRSIPVAYHTLDCSLRSDVTGPNTWYLALLFHSGTTVIDVVDLCHEWNIMDRRKRKIWFGETCRCSCRAQCLVSTEMGWGAYDEGGDNPFFTA